MAFFSVTCLHKTSKVPLYMTLWSWNSHVTLFNVLLCHGAPEERCSSHSASYLVLCLHISHGGWGAAGGPYVSHSFSASLLHTSAPVVSSSWQKVESRRPEGGGGRILRSFTWKVHVDILHAISKLLKYWHQNILQHMILESCMHSCVHSAFILPLVNVKHNYINWYFA